jgi:hypothetical protein
MRRAGIPRAQVKVIIQSNIVTVMIEKILRVIDVLPTPSVHAVLTIRAVLSMVVQAWQTRLLLRCPKFCASLSKSQWVTMLTTTA